MNSTSSVKKIKIDQSKKENNLLLMPLHGNYSDEKYISR